MCDPLAWFQAVSACQTSFLVHQGHVDEHPLPRSLLCHTNVRLSELGDNSGAWREALNPDETAVSDAAASSSRHSLRKGITSWLSFSPASAESASMSASARQVRT